MVQMLLFDMGRIVIVCQGNDSGVQCSNNIRDSNANMYAIKKFGLMTSTEYFFPENCHFCLAVKMDRLNLVLTH